MMDNVAYFFLPLIDTCCEKRIHGPCRPNRASIVIFEVEMVTARQSQLSYDILPETGFAGPQCPETTVNVHQVFSMYCDAHDKSGLPSAHNRLISHPISYRKDLTGTISCCKLSKRR